MHCLGCIVLALTLLANSPTSDSTICVPCEAEAAAFVTAENVFLAAETTLQSAEYAYAEEPSPENASRLVTAQNLYNSALAAYNSALAALDDCLNSNDPCEDTISILE